MPAFTMSVGISTLRSLRVSLTSVSSAFMVQSGQHSRLEKGLRRVVMVRKGGVEPPKPFGYRILSPARLPVPPLSLGNGALGWSARPYATIELLVREFLPRRD